MSRKRTIDLDAVEATLDEEEREIEAAIEAGNLVPVPDADEEIAKLRRPIHDDDDHAAAILAIERLRGAPEGSVEAEQLEVLVTLANAYEAEHHRLDPSDPVKAIRRREAADELKRAIERGERDFEEGRVVEEEAARRRLEAATVVHVHRRLESALLEE